MNILIICKENSCRSQLAEAILSGKFPNINFYSAGSEPGEKVHPIVLDLLEKRGIDWHDKHPKGFNSLPSDAQFNLVITVCDDSETCSSFPGNFKEHFHFPLPDPAVEKDGSEIQKKIFLAVIDKISVDLSEILTLFFEDEIIYYKCIKCGLHYTTPDEAKNCAAWDRKHVSGKKNIKIISNSREVKKGFKLY